MALWLPLIAAGISGAVLAGFGISVSDGWREIAIVAATSSVVGASVSVTLFLAGRV